MTQMSMSGRASSPAPQQADIAQQADDRHVLAGLGACARRTASARRRRQKAGPITKTCRQPRASSCRPGSTRDRGAAPPQAARPGEGAGSTGARRAGVTRPRRGTRAAPRGPARRSRRRGRRAPRRCGRCSRRARLPARDAVDADVLARRRAAPERLQQIVPRGQAIRLRGTEPPGDQRGEDVDFVHAGGGNQEVAGRQRRPVAGRRGWCRCRR